MSAISTEASDEQRVGPALPKGFLRAALLLLLRERPAHGYDLLERLGTFGFDQSDPGGLYRTLRALEHQELVDSVWERSNAGPDRRSYALTRAGAEELHRLATSMAETRGLLDSFLSRYEEFVALPHEHSKARR